MADLPELSDSTKRKLALRWSILLDTNGLTGEHLHWHERERDRLQRIAAQSPRPVRDWRTERETDETGIPSSVTVAKGRFNDLMEEYWRLWLSSGDRYESLVGWLEVLKRQVPEEIAPIWTDGSKSVGRWYKRACRPAVEKALAALVKEGTARARGEELKRLEARTKMKGDARTEAATRSAEDGIGTVQTPALNQAPTAEIAVAGKGGSGATPIPQFPNRVSWLKARLLERGWSNSDPSNHRGPDRKTIERILRGEAVRNDILKKLAEALSTKPPKVSVEDIPQD